MKIETEFSIGDHVVADDTDIVMVVTALTVRRPGVMYEVSHMWNGENKTTWVEAWRLKVVA